MLEWCCCRDESFNGEIINSTASTAVGLPIEKKDKTQLKILIKEFARAAARTGFYLETFIPNSSLAPEVVTFKLDRYLQWFRLTPSPLALRRIPDDLEDGSITIPIKDIVAVVKGSEFAAQLENLNIIKTYATISVVLICKTEDDSEEPIFFVVRDPQERRRLFLSLRAIRMSLDVANNNSNSSSTGDGGVSTGKAAVQSNVNEVSSPTNVNVDPD